MLKSTCASPFGVVLHSIASVCAFLPFDGRRTSLSIFSPSPSTIPLNLMNT